MIRPPKNLSNTLRFETGAVKTGASALEAELLGEKAFALGLAARAVEAALAELSACAAASPDRAALVQTCADKVHAFFIQREIMGFSDHNHPIAYYAIPGDVLSKVGVKP